MDDAIAALAAEHRLALEHPRRHPVAITFTVPDRDGDLAVEIHMLGPASWRPASPGSTTSPCPKSSARRPQLPAQLHRGEHVGPLARGGAESLEELFVAHADNPVTPSPNPNFNVTVSTNLSSTWLAQYFKPTFPADRTVVSWKHPRPSSARPDRRQHQHRLLELPDPGRQRREAAGRRGAINSESVRPRHGGLPRGHGRHDQLAARRSRSSGHTGLDSAKGACFVVSSLTLTATGVVATSGTARRLPAPTS